MAGELTAQDISQLAAERVRENVAVSERLLAAETLAEIADAATLISRAALGGHKLLAFGNGGSAADAQHIAGEFLGRFLAQRRALPAVALSSNPSILTAIANDYRFEDVFARQVEGLGEPGDIALGISTSGSSANVLAALRVARERGLGTIGLTGSGGGAMRALVDVCVSIPSDETPRIQEAHILAAHIMCEVVERQVVASDSS